MFSHTHTHIWTSTITHTLAHTYTHTHTHTYTLAHTYSLTHTLTNSHTHTYSHTHIEIKQNILHTLQLHLKHKLISESFHKHLRQILLWSKNLNHNNLSYLSFNHQSLHIAHCTLHFAHLVVFYAEFTEVCFTFCQQSVVYPRRAIIIQLLPEETNKPHEGIVDTNHMRTLWNTINVTTTQPSTWGHYEPWKIVSQNLIYQLKS